jgi:hypothetical protein
MAAKYIERIFTPSGKHFVGDGFLVQNVIPGSQGLSMERMSPFILLDYNEPHYFPPSETPRGVGVHPHRGFETVTIAYKGKVEHHDSHGGGGVIEEGDVQWMTAASGVLHKEFHEKQWSSKGGIFQMVQLWVNLPSKYKMSSPKYQTISGKEMPVYPIGDNVSEVRVIAGEYKSLKGKASTFTPLHLLNARLQTGAGTDFSFPPEFNTALLVLSGSISINGKEKVQANQFALFKNEDEEFEISAMEDSETLILSGEPLREPIAAQGPFVMNTRQELMQAFDDFKKGKFGTLQD